MSSLAWAFNSTAAPKEVDYLAFYANATLQTCSAQGLYVIIFFLTERRGVVGTSFEVSTSLLVLEWRVCTIVRFVFITLLS